MTERKIKGYKGLYREVLQNGECRFRIVISQKKEITQKYFYFHDADSEERALQRAKASWAEIRQRIPVITRKQNAQIERRKSLTGMVGIRRITKTSKGHPYEFWVAVWSDSRGNQRSRTYSVNKYGEEEAKKQAIKTRKDALEATELSA